MSVDRHIIFGTAGHVDHGKSSLVLALTGTDPDRLAEEKAREMTIDLGFAFLRLPGLADAAAIVDVPGHEMFVRNMVAGVTGIDAVIFVVAADESVMPQTVEHLEVVRALGIRQGVVAVTKCDKVDASKLAETVAEVRDLTRGTCLESAAVIPVSSVTRAGLDALVAELGRLALNIQPRLTEGVFRLPIDRVFTLKGIGTVITGTVVSGSLSAGETVVALPRGMQLRVRSIQVHNESAPRACAGQRAALNLPDAAKEDLERGDVLATPGSVAPSVMLDARLHLSARAPHEIAQRARVRIHHQTREVMARVVLLESDALRPGESALVQLRLESPLSVLAGDAFVMRSYSPMFVIGGGTVVDAHPPKRRKVSGADDVARHEVSPAAERVAEELDRAGPRGIRLADLCVRCGIADAQLRELLQSLRAERRAWVGRQDMWFGLDAVEQMQSAVVARLAQLHAQEPLRATVQLNAVASGAAPSPDQRECFRITMDLLREGRKVVLTGERVALSTHSPQWPPRMAAARDRLMQSLNQAGLTVPPSSELIRSTGLPPPEGKRVLEALVESGAVRFLGEDIYLSAEVFARCRSQVADFIRRNQAMSVGQCRDLLGASRKYLLPVLEQLDREGVTARNGDNRVAGRALPPA